jgi:hypothetical protein
LPVVRKGAAQRFPPWNGVAAAHRRPLAFRKSNKIGLILKGGLAVAAGQLNAINVALRVVSASYSGVKLEGLVQLTDSGAVHRHVFVEALGFGVSSAIGDLGGGTPARSREERLASLVSRDQAFSDIAIRMGVRPLTWDTINFVYESAKGITSPQAVIPHSVLEQAKGRIAALHLRCGKLGARKRLKARALLIVGSAGAGKTTILEDYKRSFPDITLEEVESCGINLEACRHIDPERLRDSDIRPIVLVEAPKKTTQRGLVAAILGAYGYKAREHWNTDEIIKRIEFFATELQTEIIFIDEGHHIVSEANDEQAEDVAEFIKSLLNRVKVQIVIAGLPRLLRLKEYAQLKRRLQPDVVLTPYNWSTRLGRSAFCALLAFFERMLDLPEQSRLREHEIAKRIYVVTGGQIGIVSKYLSEARGGALARGVRAVVRRLLAEVHESFAQKYVETEILDFDEMIEESTDPLGSSISITKDNPFFCSNEHLKELWRQRRVIDFSSDAPTTLQSGSGVRKTRVRGKGLPEYRPFGRN